MRAVSFAVIAAAALTGCGAYHAGQLSEAEQHRIMEEVAASRHAAATAFSEYAGACLEQFPGATDVSDDGSDHLSIQGAVNVALNDGGRDVVCSVDISARKIERILFNHRIYTLHEYLNATVDFEKQAAKASAETVKIVDGDHDAFITAAKLAVSKNFKDPDSAKFRGMFISNKSLPTLCGEVNAKNSYGGYVGYKKFFYNRASTVIDDGKEFGESYIYRRLAPSYCREKFADVE